MRCSIFKAMAENIPTDQGKAKPEWKGRLKFLLIAFPLMVALGVYEDYRDEQYEDRYFTALDLQLTGVARYVVERNGSNGFGIVGVEVLSTNNPYIDQRDSLKYYYCLVKNGRAELYQRSAHLIRTGDTLTINAPHRLLSIRHADGTGPDTTGLDLYDNEFFWRFVRKYYQKL